MRIIGREELKAKLDRGDNLKLVMAMDRKAYDRMHIPGSLHYSNIHEAMEQLRRSDEIILYCSNKSCNDSVNAYLVLRNHGFENLYRFSGGLAEWQDASYPLEGSMV